MAVSTPHDIPSPTAGSAHEYTLDHNPSGEMLDKVCRLRVLAWRTQAKIDDSISEWRDDFDPGARHWAMVLDGNPVAAIRMTVHSRLAEVPSAEVYAGVIDAAIPGPIASYNRLVVHPDHRGKGLAKNLDMVCIGAARESVATVLTGDTGSVHANRSRIHSMVKLGFIDLGAGAPYESDYFETEMRPNILVYQFSDYSFRK